MYSTNPSFYTIQNALYSYHLPLISCYDSAEDAFYSITTKSSHAAILLASGQSKRLGQPKQLLTQHGKTLLEISLQHTLATMPALVIVVIPYNQVQMTKIIDSLASHMSHIKTIHNPLPQSGMGHSLRLAINYLAKLSNNPLSQDSVTANVIRRVMILGVDQILLSAQHLNHLLCCHTKGIKVVASGYPPSFGTNVLQTASTQMDSIQEQSQDNTIKGLPIVVDFELLKQHQTKLQGDKGMRQIIRALDLSHIRVIDNECLSFDIDTQEQLSYARQQGWIDDL